MGTTVWLLVAGELASASFAAGMALLAWRRRASTRAAVPFAATQVGVVVWAAAGATGYLTGTTGGTAVTLVCWLMSTVSAAFVLWFSRVVADPRRPVRRRWLMALGGYVAGAVAVAAAEPWLHLLRGAPAPDGDATRPAGPLFVPLGAVALGLSLVAISLLVRSWRGGSAGHRRQVALLLGGMSITTLGGLVEAAVNGGGVPRLEAFPLWMLLTNVLYATAVLRQGMLGVVPLARHRVVDRVSDVVLIVAPDGVVLDANPAAAALLGPAVGRPVDAVLPGAGALPEQDGRHELVLQPVSGWSGGRTDLQVTRDTLFDRRGRVVGAVLVARDVTELNEQTARLAESNAQLLQQLETIGALRAELAELAVRDELTGLHNRRYLDGRLDEALRLAGQEGHPVSAVVFDVDHFKRVNDTYGHGTGDRVLREVAAVLARSTPPGDVIARHGGEEFVLLMPYVSEAAAHRRAEQLRRRIAEITVPLREGSLSLTVSAGVATVRPAAGADQEQRAATALELVEAADEALYRAKAAGRNQVLSAPQAA